MISVFKPLFLHILFCVLAFILVACSPTENTTEIPKLGELADNQYLIVEYWTSQIEKPVKFKLRSNSIEFYRGKEIDLLNAEIANLNDQMECARTGLGAFTRGSMIYHHAAVYKVRLYSGLIRKASWEMRPHMYVCAKSRIFSAAELKDKYPKALSKPIWRDPDFNEKYYPSEFKDIEASTEL